MEMFKSKLRKNDEVIVVTGKEKGKQAKILSIDREKGRVILEGLNTVKKAMRKTQSNQKGGIAEVEAPLSLSNVMIVCKKCGPTRLGFETRRGEKVRVCRKCGEQL
jgi:large subunit ribosomal protein L24